MRAKSYLRTSVTGGEEVRTVRVSGDLDKAPSGDLKPACSAPPSGRNIVLDLSDFVFIEEAEERVR
jgi:hypothetical protein